MKVECPECKWVPTENSYWECESCGTEFQMFNHGGVCVQCEHRHQRVYCIEWEGGCGTESPIEDWLSDADRGLDELNIRRL